MFYKINEKYDYFVYEIFLINYKNKYNVKKEIKNKYIFYDTF